MIDTTGYRDYLYNAAQRIRDMLTVCAPGIRHAGMYPGDGYDAFPHWILIPGTPSRDQQWGDPLDAPSHTVIARLHIGHAADGVTGDNQQLVWLLIPTVLDYFAQRPDLEDSTFDKSLDLVPDGARCELARGFSIYQNGYIGVEFRFTLQFLVENQELT